MKFLKNSILYFHHKLVTISLDILRIFDCCTVHSLTLHTKARIFEANEHVLLFHSGCTITWIVMGLARTTIVHSPEFSRCLSRLPVLYSFTHFYSVRNMNSCPLWLNYIGDSFIVDFCFIFHNLGHCGYTGYVVTEYEGNINMGQYYS